MLSDNRKNKIMEGFKNQKRYSNLGDYLYYVVEWNDVVKWQTDAYRTIFNKATVDCNITYHVSTHSFRKSFGYWIYKTHPYDPDCLLSLQKLFSHATLQQTTDYIGLTKEKNRKYINDHDAMIKNVLEGKTTDEVLKNSPVISLKAEDYGDIIMKVINAKEMSDINKYQMAINLANEKRVN